jgi:hypothetical protein
MMAKQSEVPQGGAGRLEALGAAVGGVQSTGRRPPVHLWNPPFCGDIDMRIAADGMWFYGGTPIGRPALVRLFASILRLDPDGTMLVTPVEKVRIVVDDAPFLAVEMAVDEGPPPAIRFRTNVDEWVSVDEAHPLTFRPAAADGVKPYVEVRDGLLALVKRAVFYDLVARGEVRSVDGADLFGIASAGCFFPIAPAATIEGLL